MVFLNICICVYPVTHVANYAINAKQSEYVEQSKNVDHFARVRSGDINLFKVRLRD